MVALDRVIILVVVFVLLGFCVLITMAALGNSLLFDWLIRIQSVGLDAFLLVLILFLLASYLVLMMINEMKPDKRAIVSQTPLGDVRLAFKQFPSWFIKPCH